MTIVSVQSQRPVLKQAQKLKMMPQLYQAVKLLSLPLPELKARIEEELENNPALQAQEDPSDMSLDRMDGKEEEEREELFETTSDSGYTTRRGGDGEADAKREFMEGVLTRPESLQDHLLWQLRLQPISPLWLSVGELLIRNLDENGFHRENPEILVTTEEEKLAIPGVMDLVQRFDPAGTCTRDFLESLAVQIKNHPHAVPGSLEVVEKHLDQLKKGKLKEIARVLRIGEDDVMEIKEFLGTLDPHPGRNYFTEPPRFVTPDVLIRIQDGEYVIVINDETIPVLGIDPLFEEIHKDKERAQRKEEKHFVTENLQNARWFIRSIQLRNGTLLKACRAIVEFQRDFFLKGPKYLKPLTLKDVASEIGVHEATVSRITSGKYAQTEWGLFELKYFFSNAISGTGSRGSRFSKEGVKEIIREIIGEEGNGNELSDKRIEEILKDRGITVARRTVTKYRNELKITSSYYRKP
jgi:RNA polymerase sigma-54 factor